MAWGLGGGRLSGELVYRVSLKDTGKFEADGERVRRSMGGMATEGKSTGSSLLSLGQAIQAAGALIVASKLYHWLKAGVEDFRAMRKEVRLLGQDLRGLGESGADVAGLAKRAEKLRLAYGMDDKEVVSAMRGMVGPAFGSEDINTQIEPMLQAYKAGYGELNQLIPFTTESIRVFNLQADDTTRILEEGRIAAARSYVSFDEFNNLMGRNATTLKTTNMSYEETLATIATMSAAGEQGRSLIGDLGRVLGSLRQPTAEARKELKGAGVDINQDLIPMLTQLDTAISSGKLDLSQIAPDERSQSAILTLISYLPTLQANLDAITSSSGTLKKDFGEAVESVGFKMAVMSAAGKELQESAGSGLVDALSQTLSLFGLMDEKGDSLSTTIAVLGAVLHDLVYVLVGGGTINAINQARKELGLFAHTADLLGQGKLKEAWNTQVKGLKDTWEAAGEGFNLDDVVRGERPNAPKGKASDLASSMAASAARLEELRKQYNEAMENAKPKGGGTKGTTGPKEGTEAWYQAQDRERAAALREAGFQAEMAAAVQLGFENSIKGLAEFEKTMLGEPAGGREVSAVEMPGALVAAPGMKASLTDYWMPSDEDVEAITETLSGAVMAAFEAGGISAFLEAQAKQGLEAGIRAGVVSGLKATGAASFLNMIVTALNGIPVVGPILSAVIGGFMGGFGMEYGGILKPRPKGVPIIAAEDGKPEGFLPITGQALYEVAKGIDLIRAGGPGERQALPPVGGTSRGSTIIQVSGRDILGLDIKEVEQQGAAAMALKVG